MLIKCMIIFILNVEQCILHSRRKISPQHIYIVFISCTQVLQRSTKNFLKNQLVPHEKLGTVFKFYLELNLTLFICVWGFKSPRNLFWSYVIFNPVPKTFVSQETSEVCSIFIRDHLKFSKRSFMAALFENSSDSKQDKATVQYTTLDYNDWILSSICKGKCLFLNEDLWVVMQMEFYKTCTCTQVGMRVIELNNNFYLFSL